MLDPSPGRIRCRCTRPAIISELGTVHAVRVARRMEMTVRPAKSTKAMRWLIVVAEPTRGTTATFLRAGWRCRAKVDSHAQLYGTSRSWLSRLGGGQTKVSSSDDDDIGIH